MGEGNKTLLTVIVLSHHQHTYTNTHTFQSRSSVCPAILIHVDVMPDDPRIQY